MSVFLLIILPVSLSVLAAVARAALELLASSPSDCTACGDVRCTWSPLSRHPRHGRYGPAPAPLSPLAGSDVRLPLPTSHGAWRDYSG